MLRMWSVFILSFVLTGYVFAQHKGSHSEDKGSYSQHAHHGEEDFGSDSDNTLDAGFQVGVCPIMGGETLEEVSYTYNGKVYYFCCPRCIGAFKKNPEKYISRKREFKLEAYQFGYEPAEIRVKKGDVVSIIATSRDVAHGFYIKEYNINVALKKGEQKKIEFIADKVGKFPILCSIYCGRGHHSMQGKLIVEK